MYPKTAIKCVLRNDDFICNVGPNLINLFTELYLPIQRFMRIYIGGG